MSNNKRPKYRLRSETNKRKSLDRFGDDLNELILSYLSFNDKVLFECVSKQWKRCIFNKQNEVSIGFAYSWGIERKAVDLRKYETILSKCQFITSINVNKNVRNKEKVFKLIVKYCHNLTKVISDFDGLTQKTIKEFFEKFGPNLRKIGFHSNNESNKKVFKFCHNLKALDIEWCSGLSNMFNGTEILINRLREISFRFCSDDCNKIEIFVENNKNSLESFEVFYFEEGLKPNESNLLFKELSKLTKMKVLILSYSSIDNSFADYFRDISKNCNQLMKIELLLKTNNIVLQTEILKSINCFKYLKRLSLEFWDPDLNFLLDSETIAINFSIKALNFCQNLTHLRIDFIKYRISDNFFENIDKYLPKLQEIRFSNTDITDSTIQSFAKLRELKEIFLYSEYSKTQINETFVLELIRKCLKLELIYITNQRITIDIRDKDIVRLRTETYGPNTDIEIIEYNSDYESESENEII